MKRIQTGDLPVVPMPETDGGVSFWDNLKGMGADELIATLANSVVSFTLKLALAILVFYVGRFLITRVFRAISKMLSHRNVDASLTTFVLSLVKITLFFVLIIVVVGILGIETSSFIAIFASAGVAVGMALSGTLQNFAGGVLILLLKPYKVGDFVEVQGFTGTVKSIQLFNTIINTPDNKAIIVPNGSLSTSSINNYSLEGFRRVDWSVSLAYGTDIDKAKQAMLEIVNSDNRTLKGDVEEKVAGVIERTVNRNAFAALSEMGDSAIVFTVRAWVESADYWSLYFEINERFYKELQERGFSFPFPQLDVHFDTPVVSRSASI